MLLSWFTQVYLVSGNQKSTEGRSAGFTIVNSTNYSGKWSGTTSEKDLRITASESVCKLVPDGGCAEDGRETLRLTDEGLEVPDDLVGTTGTVRVEKPSIKMNVSFTGSGAKAFSDHLLSFPTDEDEQLGDVPPGSVRIAGTLYEVIDDRSIQQYPECRSSSVSAQDDPRHCYTCGADVYVEDSA